MKTRIQGGSDRRVIVELLYVACVAEREQKEGQVWSHSLFLPPQNFRKNRNEIFRIGNDPPPPHSEVFRKFIEFGTDSHP